MLQQYMNKDNLESSIQSTKNDQLKGANVLHHYLNDYVFVNDSFIYPFEGKIMITSGYGMRYFRNKWEFHKGIDIFSSTYKILSPGNGKVTDKGYASDWGNYIIIQSGDYSFRFGHMRNQSPLNKGQDVKQGQIIGIEGTTGDSIGDHTHILVTYNGRMINPIAAKR